MPIARQEKRRRDLFQFNQPAVVYSAQLSMGQIFHSISCPPRLCLIIKAVLAPGKKVNFSKDCYTIQVYCCINAFLCMNLLWWVVGCWIRGIGVPALEMGCESHILRWGRERSFLLETRGFRNPWATTVNADLASSCTHIYTLGH